MRPPKKLSDQKRFQVPAGATHVIVHGVGGGGGGAGGGGAAGLVGMTGMIGQPGLSSQPMPQYPMGMTSGPGPKPMIFGVDLAEVRPSMKKDLLQEVLELKEREKTKGTGAKADDTNLPEGFVECNGQTLQVSYSLKEVVKRLWRKK